ncbi:MAG: S41 family peptidase [Chlamydiales bacterium]
MKLRHLFFLILLLFSPLLPAYTLLSSGDVKDVMEQLFEYHIDEKKMTPEILERSLKIYITHFDPNHSYLLKDETSAYIRPKPQFLKAMLKDYHQDNMSAYFSLNATIQKSITRARKWRYDWEQDPKKMVEEAKQITRFGDFPKGFATSLRDLKQRHYNRFLQFIAFQMKELNHSSYEGKEAKLVSLCEKQLSLLENEYLGIDDQGAVLTAQQRESKIILMALKSLANSLDSHTAYYSPEEAHVMKVQLEKGMCGIGVVLREGIDGITIHEIVKASPAYRCGKLKAGDTIVEVDGESIKGFSFPRVLEIMRGKEGSKMVLGIHRSSEEISEFQQVELIRSKITLEDKRVDVEAEPYGEGCIGKITLHSFYEGEDGVSSEKDLRQALEQLRKPGPLYGVVLDMRENSGGFLSQAVRVCGLFISNGVVVISKYSDGTIKYYRSLASSRPYQGPLVILTSRGSASATEIVAQTLQDYGVAVVVGDEQTFGKGTIQHQTVTQKNSDSFFKVTIGRYYAVSGKSTQIEGVKSNIIVPSENNFEEIGEAYLDYPLPSDKMEAAFEDPLADIDPLAQKWFRKHYLPTIQQKEKQWTTMIPVLKENSRKRLVQNKNFQQFLKKAKEKSESDFGSNDLQMEEAVSILKDMILISEKHN